MKTKSKETSQKWFLAAMLGLSLPSAQAGMSGAVPNPESPITGNEPIQITCTDSAYGGPRRVIPPRLEIAIDPAQQKLAWIGYGLDQSGPYEKGVIGPSSALLGHWAQVRIQSSGSAVIVSAEGTATYTRVSNQDKAQLVLELTKQVFTGGYASGAPKPVYLLKSFIYQHEDTYDHPGPKQLAGAAYEYCSVNSVATAYPAPATASVTAHPPGGDWGDPCDHPGCALRLCGSCGH